MSKGKQKIIFPKFVHKNMPFYNKNLVDNYLSENIDIISVHEKGKINIKKNLTVNDINGLKPDQQLKFDLRTDTQYFVDTLVCNHSLVGLFFKKTIMKPFWLRVLTSLFSYGNMFLFNALMFSDSLVLARENKSKDESNLAYTLTHEFTKAFISVLIAFILNYFAGWIQSIPKEYSESVNEALKTHNIGTVEKKLKEFHRKMRCRYIVFSIFAGSFYLFFCYYIMIFCSIYVYSAHALFYGSFISVVIKLVGFELGNVLSRFFFRTMAKRYPKVLCFKCLFKWMTLICFQCAVMQKVLRKIA